MAYNLIPKEFKPQKPLYIAYIVSGIYAIVCVIIGMTIFNANTTYSGAQAENKTNQDILIEKETQNQKLTKEYDVLNKSLEDNQEYKAKVRLKNEYETITQSYGFKYSDFIQKLGTITPVQVGIQSIKTEKENLIIEVGATSKEYFDIFENELKGLKLFSNISSNVIGEQDSKTYKVICKK
ncbi:MAG TPA: hypothetical protein DCP90_09325 [Clostridiales bacterium]|nr:MAG: hypothetical protein A2Y22_04715 [Clostridiales bacterium GWD2_32_59]HAN10794.1 hypothetical protein [Clostridiales bacterium]